ncbi:MAG: head GIN domain-containing protein [Chitinophagaceae bacterium]
MINRIQVFIVIMITAVVFQSCKKLVGEGPVVTDTRTTPGFTGVELKVPGKLYYTPGSTYKVELQSQQNILNEIETIMSGNDLLIRFRNNNTNLKAGEDIIVTITAPALAKLEVHGSGDIESKAAFNPASLRLAVNGSGSIRIPELETSSLEAEISGSGKINMIEGVTENQSLRISGSGHLDFGNFIARKTTARISGSGIIKVNTAETLDVFISGSGSVLYRGNPTVTSSVSGSGSVSKW